MSAIKPAPRPLLTCNSCYHKCEPCQHIAVNIKFSENDEKNGLIHTCEKCYLDERAELVDTTHEALKFERIKNNYDINVFRMEHCARKIQYCWFNYKYPPMEDDWYITEEETEENMYLSDDTETKEYYQEQFLNAEFEQHRIDAIIDDICDPYGSGKW